jgi:hypothetical protein
MLKMMVMIGDHQNDNDFLLLKCVTALHSFNRMLVLESLMNVALCTQVSLTLFVLAPPSVLCSKSPNISRLERADAEPAHRRHGRQDGRTGELNETLCAMLAPMLLQLF